MGLFSSLLSSVSAPVASVGFQVPPALPKIGAAVAEPIVRRASLKPAEGLPPPQTTTPAAYLSALLGRRMAVEAVGFLAHGLSDPDAVRWASDSCDLVSDRQTPPDREAADVCKRWLANPMQDNQAKAAAAAQLGEHKGPGAWAAQAAAWAGSPTEGLVGKASSGCVMLAAALTKGPLPILSAPSAPAVPQPPDAKTAGALLASKLSPAVPSAPVQLSLPSIPAKGGIPAGAARASLFPPWRRLERRWRPARRTDGSRPSGSCVSHSFVAAGHRRTDRARTCFRPWNVTGQVMPALQAISRPRNRHRRREIMSDSICVWLRKAYFSRASIDSGMSEQFGPSPSLAKGWVERRIG